MDVDALLGARLLGGLEQAGLDASGDGRHVALGGELVGGGGADAARGPGDKCSPHTACSPRSSRAGTASPTVSNPSPTVLPAWCRWWIPSAITASLKQPRARW